MSFPGNRGLINVIYLLKCIISKQVILIGIELLRTRHAPGLPAVGACFCEVIVGIEKDGKCYKPKDVSTS